MDLSMLPDTVMILALLAGLFFQLTFSIAGEVRLAKGKVPLDLLNSILFRLQTYQVLYVFTLYATFVWFVPSLGVISTWLATIMTLVSVCGYMMIILTIVSSHVSFKSLPENFPAWKKNVYLVLLGLVVVFSLRAIYNAQYQFGVNIDIGGTDSGYTFASFFCLTTPAGSPGGVLWALAPLALWFLFQGLVSLHKRYDKQ